jgi:hypothetical protein
MYNRKRKAKIARRLKWRELAAPAADKASTTPKTTTAKSRA